jgi:hypothetical protein
MSNIETKSLAFQLKAVDESEGKATFVAAAYSVDLGKDRIVPGAFGKSLESKLPLFFIDHQHDARNKLGKVLSAYEAPEGLVVDAQFNMEKQLARETFSDLAFDPDNAQFSIGYRVPKGGAAFTKDGIRELKEIDLIEVSVVAIAMNPDTRLVGVKTLLENADADVIQAIHDLTGNLLAEKEPVVEDVVEVEAEAEEEVTEERLAELVALRQQLDEQIAALEELLP